MCVVHRDQNHEEDGWYGPVKILISRFAQDKSTENLITPFLEIIRRQLQKIANP